MAASNEAKKHNQSLRDFQGVNTRSYRTVIGDNQFAWLENVMPIGFGNLTVVKGPTITAATWPAPIYRMHAVNLNGIDYEIGFGLNGAGYAINLTTYAVTTFAAAGTFSGAGTSVAQWENLQAVIVDPTKGYFTWDGTTFTAWVGTLQSLTITAIGKDYTSAPTIAFSSGSAAATCHIQLGLASIIAGDDQGSGYAKGDILVVNGGTSILPAKIQVASVNILGAITGITLYATGDYTVAPSSPVTVTGGYGTAAKFTVNFGIGPITLTNTGTGYTSAPTVTVSGGSGTAGAVTANLTTVPSGGTAVATYAGRVWVASSRTLAFSAPSSYNDFSSTAAGGSLIVVDETLHSQITGILSANNFLYVFGTSSINVISDVQVVSGATVFSNSNVSASVGSSMPTSISAYYRGVWFAAPFGLHALYGTTTQKVSDDLDGVFNQIDTTQDISSGQALLSGLLVQAFLFKYNDPNAGARALLACFCDKKWFFASQTSDLTQIDGANVAGIPTLYGTNGTTLVKLFADASTALPHKIVTKLWDMGTALQDKQSFKLGVEMTTTLNPQSLTGTIDTERATRFYPFTLPGGQVIQWVNNAGQVVQWVNNSGAIVQWVQSGYSFQMGDVGTTGKYLGITLNSSTQGVTYSGLHLQFESRAVW